LCMYCYHACPKDAVKLRITRVGKMWLKMLLPEFKEMLKTRDRQKF